MSVTSRCLSNSSRANFVVSRRVVGSWMWRVARTMVRYSDRTRDRWRNWGGRKLALDAFLRAQRRHCISTYMIQAQSLAEARPSGVVRGISTNRGQSAGLKGTHQHQYCLFQGDIELRPRYTGVSRRRSIRRRQVESSRGVIGIAQRVRDAQLAEISIEGAGSKSEFSGWSRGTNSAAKRGNLTLVVAALCCSAADA